MKGQLIGKKKLSQNKTSVKDRFVLAKSWLNKKQGMAQLPEKTPDLKLAPKNEELLAMIKNVERKVLQLQTGAGADAMLESPSRNSKVRSSKKQFKNRRDESSRESKTPSRRSRESFRDAKSD